LATASACDPQRGECSDCGGEPPPSAAELSGTATVIGSPSDISPLSALYSLDPEHGAYGSFFFGSGLTCERFADAMDTQLAALEQYQEDGDLEALYTGVFNEFIPMAIDVPGWWGSLTLSGDVAEGGDDLSYGNIFFLGEVLPGGDSPYEVVMGQGATREVEAGWPLGTTERAGDSISGTVVLEVAWQDDLMPFFTQEVLGNSDVDTELTITFSAVICP
jgi:hypothetical protein